MHGGRSPSRRPERAECLAFVGRGACSPTKSAMVASVQWLHYNVPMPTITRLTNCAITMYAADHQPPHFHVRMKDGREALIVIETLSVLSGSIKPRELFEALVWAEANRQTLTAKWQELNP